jgi:hypothetical protein
MCLVLLVLVCVIVWNVIVCFSCVCCRMGVSCLQQVTGPQLHMAAYRIIVRILASLRSCGSLEVNAQCPKIQKITCRQPRTTVGP